MLPALLSMILTSLVNAAPEAAPAPTPGFKVEKLAQQEEVIWGFDFLPDGKILFTERNGAFRLYDHATKNVMDVAGAPKVWAKGQGGLLDVALHPNFAKNRWVYFTFSQPLPDDKATTALGRGTLAANGLALNEVKVLFSTDAANDNRIHFGSRVVFDGPDTLFLSVSDRDERNKAQLLDNHHGKILRLDAEGRAKPGNPFAGGKGRPEIWSYGHRSVQGLSLRKPGDLWEAEMGPRGGDEVNHIQPGKNYGWPVVTYGREYWGPKIGEKEKAGMEQPVAHWVPSISPSGMDFYRGDKFPAWRGNIFLANLSSTHLRRLELSGDKVVKQEELLKDLNRRFRQVKSGPDGFLYFATDDGLLGRLIPSW